MAYNKFYFIISFGFCTINVPQVNAGAHDNSEVSHVWSNPYFNYICSLRTGHLISVALNLEKEVLKIEKVGELFTPQILKDIKNSDQFDQQLRWNFNAIIGLQIANINRFRKFTDLKPLFESAIYIWRRNYLDIITCKIWSDTQSEGLKEKLERINSFQSFTEIVKDVRLIVSNNVKPELPSNILPELHEAVEFKFAVEILLTVVPKKQKILFEILLDYFEQGALNDVCDFSNENINNKLKAYMNENKAGVLAIDVPSNEDSKYQISINDCILIYYYASLEVGFVLSQQLKLTEKVLKREKIKELITPEILAKNPMLQWHLESLIGIETAISNHFRKNDRQKKVFDSAVALWIEQNFDLPKNLPSTPIGDTSEQLKKILEEKSSKSAIEEIIEEASRAREIQLTHSEYTLLCSYLEFKISLKHVLLMVPQKEGILLNKVSRYFEDGLFNDIEDTLTGDIIIQLKTLNQPLSN